MFRLQWTYRKFRNTRFSYYHSRISRVLPHTLQTIGYGVFSQCKGLTGELNIPESVRSIGMGAFAGCSGLTGQLKIPSNTYYIETNVFHSCSGFTG